MVRWRVREWEGGRVSVCHRVCVCVLEGVFSNPVFLLCCSSSKGQRVLLLLLKHTQARAHTHTYTQVIIRPGSVCVCVCVTKEIMNVGKRTLKQTS